MKALYTMLGITKQAHYQRLSRIEAIHQCSLEVLNKVQELRKEHPKMGCRKLYSIINPEGIGRDRFEQLLISNGLRVKHKRNYRRTTRSGSIYYDNLISGVQVNSPDQMYVSDITYLLLADGKFLYLTLVKDVYSKIIVGYSLSKSLMAEDTVLPAYLNAISKLTEEQRSKLIFHSDRGSQYVCNAMREHHTKFRTKPSMGGKAWENAHAESLNGILKNEYFEFQGKKVNFQQVEKCIKLDVEKYNTTRPHGSLKNMQPIKFKTYVLNLKLEQRPIMKINY
jgi:putative transposase